MQRRVPVGFRFRPTEQELVAHYLRHKLMAHHPSIYSTIPEIDVCKYEPWDLFALAASALPETDPDDSECYFFSPRDYKYSNSTRSNRATPLGFWKVTGKDRKIKDLGTNKVIGIKKVLVFYEGRVPRGIRRNWIIHEYHDDILPQEQRTYVLCKLMKKYEKKTKEKTVDFEHELIDDERESNGHNMDFEHENQADFYMNSEEQYLSNMNSSIQTFPQSSEVISSSIQTASQPNEAINSSIHTFSQSNEAIDSSTIQVLLPSELKLIKETPLDFDFDLDYDYGEFYYTPTMDEQGFPEMMATSYTN